MRRYATTPDKHRDAAAVDYARANEGRQSSLASPTSYQRTKSTLGQEEATVDLDAAAIAKAQLNLERTVIRSPVDGYVTNLQARLGDYANVGEKIVSVVEHQFLLGRRLFRGDQPRGDP